MPPPNTYKQSTLSINTIPSLGGNGNIYLFTADLCSPFARGCVSAGRVKQIVTTLINGRALLCVLALNLFFFSDLRLT